MTYLETKSAAMSSLASQTVAELGKMTKHQIDEVLHECADRQVIATGTELIAVGFVQSAAQVVKEERD